MLEIIPGQSGECGSLEGIEQGREPAAPEPRVAF